MPTLVIISCGGRKIFGKIQGLGPTPAKDVYIGGFFRLNREYGEKFSDKWLILSAKYGFIEPDFKIPENYNITFKKRATNPISTDTLKKQIKEMGLESYQKIIVLGGKDYIERIKEAFSGYKGEISTPFEGLTGIGYMQGKVKNAIKTNSPF